MAFAIMSINSKQDLGRIVSLYIEVVREQEIMAFAIMTES